MSHTSQFTLLKQRRFAPFFWTQFFGAANDNVFKVAFTALVTYQAALFPGVDGKTAAFVISAIFILPFVLFSATSGQLSDKYDTDPLLAAPVGVAVRGVDDPDRAGQQVEDDLDSLILRGVVAEELRHPAEWSAARRDRGDAQPGRAEGAHPRRRIGRHGGVRHRASSASGALPDPGGTGAYEQPRLASPDKAIVE